MGRDGDGNRDGLGTGMGWMGRRWDADSDGDGNRIGDASGPRVLAGGRAAVLPRGCRVSPQPPPSQAVRLESARPQRVRYLLVVRPEEADAEGQTVLLGVDFPHEG